VGTACHRERGVETPPGSPLPLGIPLPLLLLWPNGVTLEPTVILTPARCTLSEPKALIPIEQRSVDFYEDQILAVIVEVEGERRIYVPMRPIAQYLGLSWPAQTRRIQRDPVLAAAAQGVAVTATPSQDKEGMTVTVTPPSSGRGGGPQEMLCLPAEMLHGWLFGVSVNRVKAELRDKVIRYQRECYRVLWEAFQRDLAPASTQGRTQQGVALGEIRALGLAVAQLAEEQMRVEALAMNNADRLDRAAQVVGQLGRRLMVLEQRIAPASLITEEQAAAVSLQVKALAEHLTQSLGDKNYYQSVFAELYRRFGVSSYKNIRQEQYPAVVGFLEEWRKSAGKG
jgi:hypothetical protein